MQFFRNSSIRRKQTLIIMFTASVALLLLCAAVSLFQIITFRRELANNMTTFASMIGNNVSAALDFNDPKSAEETLSALKAEPDIVGACVFSRDGTVFAQYKGTGGSSFQPPPKIQAMGHSFGRNSLSLFQPITSKGDVIGVIYLQSTMRSLRAQLLQYGIVMGTVFGATLFIALLLSNRLQRLISQPILDLVWTMRAVAEGKNYSLRVSRRNLDEIGALVDGFNHMLAQIQERDANLERRVAERTQALRESEALYSSLVEQLPAGIFRKDVEGRYVLVNSWFCRFKNVKPELFLGKKPQEVAAIELAAKDANSPQIKLLAAHGTDDHATIIKTGKPIDAQEEYRMPDGSKRYLHVIKSPLFGADGQAIGSQGILMDITERKRAEAELNYERNLLCALMDNSDDCIYFKDAQSRFLRCSTWMAKRFNHSSADEIVGKHDRDFFASEHAEEAFEDEQHIIRTGEPVIGKVERETWPDGRITWVLTSKLPLRNEAGDIVGTFGISKDITPIKEAEAKLGQIHNQLVDASRQAGMAEIATSVLHNVGNVLNSINVSSQLIADKLRNSKIVDLGRAAALLRGQEGDLVAFFAKDPRAGQLPVYLEQLAEHLIGEQRAILNESGDLMANVAHVKEIISMQQNYARAAGVSEWVNVIELIEDALRINEGGVRRHHIKVIRDFTTVPAILTQKHKVLQIMVNLIRNAKYACDDSNQDDRQIILRVANCNGCVKILVSDNGIGIPAENLTRIFNHGFTTRKDGHGFGLHSGALAAKEIGGSLTAFSEGQNHGATFTLELPINSQP